MGILIEVRMKKFYSMLSLAINTFTRNFPSAPEAILEKKFIDVIQSTLFIFKAKIIFLIYYNIAIGS